MSKIPVLTIYGYKIGRKHNSSYKLSKSKLLAEIIVDKDKIIIRSKDFREEKRQRMQDAIREYLKRHKLLKRNMPINKEAFLENIMFYIATDALENIVVIEGYNVCPIEVEIEKREVRLRRN